MPQDAQDHVRRLFGAINHQDYETLLDLAGLHRQLGLAEAD